MATQIITFDQNEYDKLYDQLSTLVLVHKKTEEPVTIGEIIVHDNKIYQLINYRRPHKVGPTGRIYVQEIFADGNVSEYNSEYFPSVCGLKWVAPTKE